MDKLASHFLSKAPSNVAILDSFPLDESDSDLDSDDERWRPPPPIKMVEVVKYESLNRDKVEKVYRETLGRLSLAWSDLESVPEPDECPLESQRSLTSIGSGIISISRTKTTPSPRIPDSQRSKSSGGPKIPDSRRGKSSPLSEFPESYRNNTEKEKLLIWYCENFRRQYSSRVQNRRPLVMALENECGVQKMVCTSIHVTRIPIVEFKSWEGCASFVSDHIVYEPLDHPTNLPTRLRAPCTVFGNQSGNAFELSTLLVSLLVGAKIDAYVVSGYATREVCNNDQCRVVCPLLPRPEVPHTGPDKNDPALRNQYVPKPVPDFKSKFEKMMDQRKADEEAAKRREEDEIERLRLAEEEKLPPDELEGWRLHSWVLIKLRREEEDGEDVFFVEPITGQRSELEDDQYLGIESVWNHENYWVNMQSTNTRPALDFTLTNRKLWAPLLFPGIRKRGNYKKPEYEPGSRKAEKYEALVEIMQEKCLDIPVTWTEELTLSLDKYIRGRYKHNKKQIQYKRAISEQYSDYKHPNGLVERVVQYVDLECEIPSRKYEQFKNRADKLYKSDINYENEIVQEYFDQGRPDGLAYHRHLLGEASEFRSGRTLNFHLSSRLDRFSSAQLNDDYFLFKFDSRNDKLAEIYVEYAMPRKKRAMSLAVIDQEGSEYDEAGEIKPNAGTITRLGLDSQNPATLESPKPISSPKGILGSPKLSIDSPKTMLSSPKGLLGSSKPSLDSPRLTASPRQPGGSLSKQGSLVDSARKSSTSITDSPRNASKPSTGQPPSSPKPGSTLSKPGEQSPGGSSPRKSVVMATLDVPDAAGDTHAGVRYDRGEDSVLICPKDIRSFYVRYDRTEGKCHDEDVSKVIFNLQHGEISVYYHYGDNNITQSYRKFQTSAVNNWDDLSDLVKCYRSNDNGTKPDSNAFLSKLIQTYVQRQSDYLETIARYANEIRSLLNVRKIDRYKPKLVANIFYLETDERVKEAYLRECAREREAELKQLAMNFDYAEFYLSKIPSTELENPKSVRAAREKCLRDLKEIWKRRVDHFQVELTRIKTQLEELRKTSSGVEENAERKKELMNEKVIVERVLEPYTDREQFAEKCRELENSFEEYVTKMLGARGERL